jgi:hypothetical protein
MGKNQWVVRHGDAWAQRGEGNSLVTRTFDPQREAIESARETGRREGGELFIQNQSGQIRERNSYGYAPHPPKGMTQSWVVSPTAENRHPKSGRPCAPTPGRVDRADRSRYAPKWSATAVQSARHRVGSRTVLRGKPRSVQVAPLSVSLATGTGVPPGRDDPRGWPTGPGREHYWCPPSRILDAFGLWLGLGGATTRAAA